MSQKSYDNNSTLYLIPTPIGNFDDITLRAIQILKTVEVIYAEDTRVTLNLLNHLDIKKKVISNNKINEIKNKDKIIENLKNGCNVGLVTDRGTPVISDPGYEIVKHVIKNGYNVVGLPGPTALIPALIVSGIKPMPFAFIGFLNNKEAKRKKELEMLKELNITLILYESPHRILKTLINIKEVMGNRKISISREISKKFEEVYRGRINDVIKELSNVRGEFVIVLEGNTTKKQFSNLTIIEHVNLYIKEGYSSMESIKMVAKDRNMRKNIIYNKYHKID